MTSGPDFLIVGAMKSGTTALNDFLSRHPQIFMSKKKEPHYFSSPSEGELPPWLYEADHESHKRIVTHRSEYLNLFKGSGDRLCGESSALYLNDAKAAERAAAMNPRMRIIAILREPASRAYSAWNYISRLGLEDLSFPDALRAESSRVMGPGFHYVTIGAYATALQPWIDAFGRDRVLVLNYDELLTAPMSVGKALCDFLEVDDELMPSSFPRLNSGGGIPGGAFQRWVLRRIRAIVTDKVPPALAQKVNSAWQKHLMVQVPPMPPEIADEIRATLLSETVRLEQMLSWDLPAWKPLASKAGS